MSCMKGTRNRYQIGQGQDDVDDNIYVQRPFKKAKREKTRTAKHALEVIYVFILIIIYVTKEKIN